MDRELKLIDGFQRWMGSLSIKEIVSNAELVKKMEVFLKRLKTGR